MVQLKKEVKKIKRKKSKRQVGTEAFLAAHFLTQPKIMKQLTKELAQKLMEVKGEARGMTLKTDWQFILLKEGKEGLKKLEDRMAELGVPIKYKEIKSMDFYPIGLDVISMLAIKELFHFDEKDFEEMGGSAIKFSLILKIFMKYFVPLRSIANQVPKMWREHYTIGDLEMPEFSEGEKYIILRLKNFRVHPIYCISTKGYFSKIAEMLVKSSVDCEETKCVFRGDEYHEFLLKW